MTRRNTIAVLCFATAFFALVTLLFLPAGSDIYVFSTGGKMILDGKIPYKDFIDSKPPGIFYLYAVMHAVFGSGLEAVRIFDLLYHVLTLGLFYILLRRYTNDKRVAILSIPIYALWYAATGIWSTAQSESFAVLPTIIIVWSVLKSLETTSRKKVFLYSLLAGLAAIVNISLKFTLVYPILIAIGVVCWYHTSKKTALLYTSVIVAAIAAMTVYFYWWLSKTGASENFSLMMEWLKGYSSLNPFNDLRTFTITFFEDFPKKLFAYYSPLFIVSGIIGLYIAYSRKHKVNVAGEPSIKSTLHIQLILQLAIGLLTILFERKNIPYHFSRSFWAFTPFIAIGIIAIRDILKRSWKQLKDADIFSRVAKRSLISTTVILLLCGTPLLKLYSEAFSYMLLQTSGYKSESIEFYDQIGNESQLDEVQAYLKTAMHPNDNFFVWGTIIGLHSRMNITPPTIMLTNIQIRSSWTSEALKQKILQQLNASPPRYIIIESDDFLPNLIGTIHDSYGSYLVWEDFRNFVDEKYVRDYEAASFIVFKRL